VLRKGFQLKSQDILLLLKLIATRNGACRVIDLAHDLGVSPSEISHGLKRLQRAQLLSSDRKEPLRVNALEFLIHGLKYVFPAEIGPMSRGMPTAHSAPPLAKRIVSSDREKYVWPASEGEERGQSIAPLYSSAPFAASKDRELHELLALVDALRVGRAREKKLAEDELTKRIGSDRAA
jgi:hypothetical protein